MIDQFPLDPMHLVDLGVAKRLLTYILGSFSKTDKENMSVEYASFSKFIPIYFSRKTRDFSELPRWKATEFRLFIMYTAMVFLRDKLSDDWYYHTILLIVAIRILSDENTCQVNVEHAQEILNEFVKLFPQFYGLKHVNYNVHSLLHLLYYVKLYGCLDSFSGYRYENFMQEFKKNIKNPKYVLEQLCNRVQERIHLNNQLRSVGLTNKNDDIFPGCTTYKSYNYGSICYKLNNCDCFSYIVNNNEIIPFYIKVFRYINNEKFVSGQRFIQTESFFKEPIDSKDLNILQVSDKSDTTELFNVNQISGKYCRLPFKDNFVLIPICHNTSKINFIE